MDPEKRWRTGWSCAVFRSLGGGSGAASAAWASKAVSAKIMTRTKGLDMDKGSVQLK
jgi:hypothetical protein